MKYIRVNHAVCAICVGFAAVFAGSVHAELDAEAVYEKSGLTGGLVVVLDCNDGKFAGELAAADGFLVHALDDKKEDVASARANLLSKGLYGKVQVNEFDGKNLPYVDNLVNLLIAEKLGDVRKDEIMRVLAPMGVAIVGDERIIKAWPEEIKEWSHYLNESDNNAVSVDERAGYPRNLQWAAGPLWSRHHDKQASISALVTTKGRLYYIEDRGPVYSPEHDAQWLLQARNAFNGLQLWTKPMKSWVSHLRGFRSGPVQIARLLVADEDRIFVTMGINEPVAVINGVDGEIIRELENTAKAEEMVFHKGSLLVIVGNKVVEHAYDNNANIKEKALVAVNPDNGKLLWRYPEDGFADIVPQTLTASDGRVVLQHAGDNVCLALKDGRKVWSQSAVGSKVASSDEGGKGKSKKGAKTSKKMKPSGRKAGWVVNTVVISDGVVLASEGSKLRASSLKDGKPLWEASAGVPFGRVPSVDILVIDSVVWASPSFADGHDLHTGKVVHKLDKSEVVTAGHHHRCYRNKGLGDFILYGYRGIDYLDTKGESHSRNNWVRGLCQYGVMPANGLINVPTHNCGCYPEAMLRGFNALAPKQAKLSVPADFKGELEKGPAYKAKVSGLGSKSSESWNTYRGNGARASVAAKGVSSDPKKVWEREIASNLTAPVVSAGVVLVASKDNQTLYALDQGSGKELWKHTAGGQVDSPPTIYGDTVLFGSADGCVSSLSLKTGALRWKFNAAPSALKTVAFGKVESLWPVNGSILVKNDIAYFSAGRNAYLDEGLFLFGLDASSGDVKYSTRIKGEHPGAIKPGPDSPKSVGFSQNKKDYKTFESPDQSDGFSMYGNIGDVMTADDDSIYLRHMRFNDKLEQQKEFKHHLFTTSTFVDDNEAHRSHFFYGNGDFSYLPVAYEWLTRGSYGGFNIPAAKHMVVDDDVVWGAVHGKKGNEVFAADAAGLDEKYEKNFPARDPSDRSNTKKPSRLWSKSVNIHTRAMLKAGDKIVLGGSAEISQLLGTSEGGSIVILSAKDGSDISSMQLESVPVFAGMAASEGNLYLSLQNGKLVSYK